MLTLPICIRDTQCHGFELRNHAHSASQVSTHFKTSLGLGNLLPN